MTSAREQEQTQLLKLYLQLVLEMRSVPVRQVIMEESQGQVVIALMGNDAEPLKVLTSQSAMPNWMTFLLDRVYFWPDPKDELYATNAGKVKRLLLAPNSKSRLECDFIVGRKPGVSGSQIMLSNIVTEELPYLGEHLSFTKAHRESFERIVKRKNGIVLASTSQKPHTIDAVATLLAVRPDAIAIKHCSSEKSAADALALAETHFVVVGMTNDDPIESALGFLGLVSARSALVDQYATLLAGSVIHRRVRRVCAGCTRSTPVDPRTLDKVPIQLRAKTKNTYMFGRGCDLCGHGAYRGTVGISSVLDADDVFQKMLREQASAAELTRAVYKRGARSLLEDGLEKIFAGQTSFEEVFAVTSKISAAFAGAIAASEQEGSADQGKIESIDSLSFDSSDAARGLDGKKRVLIIEDDGDQRAVLENVFVTEGYEVTLAPNGKEALQALETRQVDVIICDIMMPVMNGAQFLKELRGNVALKSLPVLMLTAVSSPDAECALLSHGADDYCEKSVKRKVLVQRVEKLLARSKSKSRPASQNPLNHFLRD